MILAKFVRTKYLLFTFHLNSVNQIRVITVICSYVNIYSLKLLHTLKKLVNIFLDLN